MECSNHTSLTEVLAETVLPAQTLVDTRQTRPVASTDEVKVQLEQLRQAEVYKPELDKLQLNLLSLMRARHPEAKSLWNDYVRACSAKEREIPDFFSTGEDDENFDEADHQ